MQSQMDCVDVYANRLQLSAANLLEEIRNMSLYNYCSLFNVFGSQIRKRRSVKSCPRVIPYINYNPSSDNHEIYCRNMILLHVPWNNTPAILVDGTDWISLFNQLIESHQMPAYVQYHVEKYNRSLSSSKDDNDSDNDAGNDDNGGYEEDDDHNVSDQLPAWAHALQLMPHLRREQMEEVMMIPPEFDWTESYALAADDKKMSVDTWLDEAINVTAADVQPNRMNFDSLNNEQRQFVDIINNRCLELAVDSDDTRQICLSLQGVAGTGKSFAIQQAFAVIDFKLGCNPKKYKVMAPTGCAAFNVRGTTIHNGLVITTRRIEDAATFALLDKSLEKLAKKYNEVKFVFIDEMSMIGCSMLCQIDRRLRQITKSNEPFGGLNVILSGDMRQLAPIGDKSLESDDSMYDGLTTSLGRMLFRESNFVVIRLIQQMRQRAEQTMFIRILSNIRNKAVRKSDVYNLNQRYWDYQSPQTKASFRDAIYLFLDRKSVTDHNLRRLRMANLPVYESIAEHTGSKSKALMEIGDDKVLGLSPILYLSIGAKVMLKINLWVDMGLVNGSMGEVVDVWSVAESNLPIAVFVKFNDYIGPSFDANVAKVVPIIPVTRAFRSKINGEFVSLTRTQIPLSLAYAMTIHKSQGLTLPKTAVNLTGCYKTDGLAYVALSRVKEIDDLTLMTVIPSTAFGTLIDG